MTGGDEWRVREGTDSTIVVALYLRTALGIRDPHELPPLRGVTAPDGDAPAELVAQWRQFWQMTVEPEAHPAEVPLELMPGYDTLVALPTTSEVLRRAAAPLAEPALAHLRRVRERQHVPPAGEQVWRAAVQAEEERRGREAFPFSLNLQILPLSQRGIWWIGELTVAVSDGLRDDVAAFGGAIRPIVSEVF